MLKKNDYTLFFSSQYVLHMTNMFITTIGKPGKTMLTKCSTIDYIFFNAHNRILHHSSAYYNTPSVTLYIFVHVFVNICSFSYT